MDAVATYVSQGATLRKIDGILASQKILFCCYSRLMATLWVRAERGRHRSHHPMPLHLAGSCTTEAEALELVESQAPTLIISTQVLEEGSGIDLITKIKEIDPHMPTLLFLQHRNAPLYREAIRTHSDGIILEPNIGAGQIIAALDIVCKGGMYLEPSIGQALAGSAEPSLDPGLTPRELEVMRHVVIGLNDREIGETLHLATDTIKYHLKQVYAKLSVHNRTRAAISLVLMGLVPPPLPLIPE